MTHWTWDLWQANRDDIERIGIGRRASRDRRADWWTVYDAGALLRTVSVLRWTPETRALIYAAREAVRVAMVAMRDEAEDRDVPRKRGVTG